MASRPQQLQAWVDNVGKNQKGPVAELDFDTSANQLRDLLRTGLLKMTDLRDDPTWFFEAHRIVAKSGNKLGQGFWTRFTVQYNLFAGTVLAVGNPEQVESLATMQNAQELGCFGLTEKFAGVSSGMVVETIAEFDLKTREFILNTPNQGSYKNWISQGFVADKSVVVADLHIGGKSFGPHAFLIDFRRVTAGGKKEVVGGIRLADMGRKTVCNDLDNAWIAFDGVRVPESAMLDRYSGIDKEGKYTQKQKGMHTMAMVGQRLFTGRVAVAQAALAFGRQLFAKTKQYTDKKLCWAPGGLRPPLSALPQLIGLNAETDEALSYAERYTGLVEAQLTQCLLENKIPNTKLIEAIAVAKIRSVETVVQNSFKLKQTVGSYALMADSGFAELEAMQIAKFAEGESFVLMQKLARDRIKDSKVANVSAEEAALVAELQQASPQDWVAKTDKVYFLAELIMDRIMKEWCDSAPPRGIPRPMARL